MREDTYFLLDLRNMSNSACILQERAWRLWSGGQLVTMRWPRVASLVSLSSASVKNQTFLFDNWNQVFKMTASLVWWNWALVLTLMKMSSWLRSHILALTGLGSVDWILFTNKEGAECLLVLSWSLVCNGTRAKIHMTTIESTRAAQLKYRWRLEPRMWGGHSVSLSFNNSLVAWNLFSMLVACWQARCVVGQYKLRARGYMSSLLRCRVITVDLSSSGPWHQCDRCMTPLHRLDTSSSPGGHLLSGQASSGHTCSLQQVQLWAPANQAESSK